MPQLGSAPGKIDTVVINPPINAPIPDQLGARATTGRTDLTISTISTISPPPGSIESSLTTSERPPAPVATSSIAPDPSFSSTISVSSTATVILAPASTPSSSSVMDIQTTSSNRGLIVAVGVLGGLLGIALIALLVLACRRRKREEKGGYAATYELKDVAAQDSPSTSGLEATVNELEIQLHDKDMQLRDLQATLLEQGHDIDESSMDDGQVIDRFTRLRRTIDDWTQSHFKNVRLDVNLGKDVATVLQRSQPSYLLMMQDPQLKQLLIGSVVSERLYQGFTTSELLGIPAFTELNQTIVMNASLNEINDWRSQTLTLLSKSPSYRAERDSSVSSITQTITTRTSALAGFTASNQSPALAETRRQQLHQIVDMAATLALDLARSKTMYKVTWDKVGSVAFDVVNMEDVLGGQGGDARGRVVRMVVFPGVKRVVDAGASHIGDRDGRGSAMDGRGSAMAGMELHTILKELVLVDSAAPGTAR